MGKSDLNILLEKYEELHKLLCDYDQEERFIERIHNVIQGAIDELPKGSRIGFRPYGDPTIWLIRNFDFSHVNIIGTFDKNISLDNPNFTINVYEMSSPKVEDVDVFIMTSFNKRHEIISELERDKYSVLDIYHSLEQKGIHLHAPIHLYMKKGHAVLHDYLKRWKNEESENALRELLTAACEAKDFVMLKNLCEKYVADYPFVEYVREKYNEFYSLIRELVEKREQKDIIMYWLDAVPYKWREHFKELNNLEKEALCFEQVYTGTPYTAQTCRMIFSGLLPLTDWEKSLEKVGYENSELIRYLKEKNYMICWIGVGSPIAARRWIEDDFAIVESVGISCNAVLWQALCKMLASDIPCFLISHLCAETHPPMLCAELENLRDVYTVEDPLEQFKVSANYVDQRVMFYHQIMRVKQRIQIVMSDHGEHVTGQFPKWYWAQHKLHACCFLTGNGIHPKHEKRIFSFQKFIELMKWLIEPEKNKYENCLSEYAVFQDTDIYSEELINRFIKSGKIERALAYRGALDGTYKYAINRMGREFFYKIMDDKDVEIEEGEAPAHFARLRKFAGTDFPDLSHCEQYKHVYKIYKAMEENAEY